MSETIREPIQQRSIIKKNKIIEVGYKLFSKNGYFNTNTAEIAKEAKVSIGILYGYFHDKRDILLDVLDIYVDKVFEPMFEMFSLIKEPINFDILIPHIIDECLKMHKNNAGIHNALHSLSYFDNEVRDKFLFLEEKITTNLEKILIENHYSPNDLKERLHLAMETIQSYAHERIFDSHSYIDYSKMHSQVISMIKTLFEKN